MNWAFELLGLAPDADVASVKRAYARLLRTTRPDEDPEAFQRLHAAYKMVLAHVNTRPAATAHPIATQAALAQNSEAVQVQSPSPQPMPAQANIVTMAVSAINFDALTNEIIRAATEASNGQVLSNWLHAREEFWSIQVKQQSGHRVLQRLFQQPKTISADCMDALLHFFDLDHVLSGIEPVALKNLRERQTTLWELLPSNHRVLAQRIGKQYGKYPELGILQKNIALLQSPFSWLRACVVAASVGRVRGIAHLVQALLGHGNFQQLPPSIDRQHALFWFRAATRGPMTWPRFALRSFQMGLAAFGVALAVTAIYFLRLFFPVDASAPGRIDLSATTKAFAISWSATFGFWLLFAGSVWFDQWQGLPESVPSRWPWLRRLAIPMACISCLVVQETGAVPYVEWLIALCFIFAIRRSRRRGTIKNDFFARISDSKPGFIWVGVMVLSAFSRMHDLSDFPFIPLLAALTLGISIADLWRHRAYLHPKLARS
ncbi:J domain-containing protein [Dyella flagellata]|uniref:J domain-containing protein n=1 Tax=Dyella flagellata TaxID=1867833 RepID=A0ABQ5XF41_9GAMM|nr:J domain-containing protein [Dyella flagellata]GLQ90296.1 hypothetical protein GCM10007898_38710 [Dyella flagellata]